MTTIKVREETKKRLDSYKTDEMTYDDLLNYLMDTIPTEDIIKRISKNIIEDLKHLSLYRKTISRVRGITLMQYMLSPFF